MALIDVSLKRLSLKDSRGKESKTLSFVFVSWVVLVFKFLVAGMTLGPLGTMSPMNASDFGMAVGTILAIWLGREWTEKKTNSSNPPRDTSKPTEQE